jgi:hypothetical protein
MKSIITLFLLFSQFSMAKTNDQIDLELISMKGHKESTEVKEACLRINQEVQARLTRFINSQGLNKNDLAGGAELKIKADPPTRWSRNQFIHQCRLKLTVNHPDLDLKVSDSKIKHRGNEQMESCLQERDVLNSDENVLYSELFASLFNCQNLNIVKVISQRKNLDNQ